MKRVTKLEVAYAGLIDTLLRVLREWKPPSLKSELDYRDALFVYLRNVLPEDARVEKEYRHAGTTSDIYLRWKGMLGGTTEVSFELKRNLKRKVEFDRLVGQIEGIDPSRNMLVVVLIGDLDESLVARLTERYSKLIDGPSYLGGSKMAVVEVP